MVAVLLLAGGIVLGQVEAPPDELTQAVRQLVRQLDAPEKSRRDEAEQKLIELGPTALAKLPDAQDASAEVQLRLGRVRNRLEQAAGEASAQASQITLKQTDMKLAELLTALEKQTGNRLIDHREQFGQQVDEVTLDVNLDKAPFWPSLDALLDQAGMVTYPFSGEKGLAIVSRAGGAPPKSAHISYSGAFRLEANEIVARRDFRNPMGDNLRIMLLASWEPRLAPIAIMQPPGSVQAKGDQGEALATDSAESEPEITINPDTYSVEFPLVFALPPRNVTRIAELKGKLEVMLPSQTADFRFPKLAGAADLQQRQAGTTVILERVRKNNLVWEVRMRVAFDKAGQALESHRTWVLHNEAFLEGPDKQPIKFAGMETTRQTENEVGVAYLFDVEDIKNHTFVYRTPTTITKVAIEYTLKDLELP